MKWDMPQHAGGQAEKLKRLKSTTTKEASPNTAAVSVPLSYPRGTLVVPFGEASLSHYLEIALPPQSRPACLWLPCWSPCDTLPTVCWWGSHWDFPCSLCFLSFSTGSSFILSCSMSHCITVSLSDHSQSVRFLKLIVLSTWIPRFTMLKFHHHSLPLCRWHLWWFDYQNGRRQWRSCLSQAYSVLLPTLCWRPVCYSCSCLPRLGCLFGSGLDDQHLNALKRKVLGIIV